MIHAYTLFGKNIVLDVPSGAVHELDDIAFGLIGLIEPPMTEAPPPGLSEEQLEAWGELYELYANGLLLSEEGEEYVPPSETPLKALCLHVAHDCNLRCAYCFASTGDFGGERALMPFETAARAIDYLLSRCGPRRNLEIDFFGGEPLLALDTVKRTVDYARKAAPDKSFRFTITTNGLLLDGEAARYINDEMDNVVLSLDGRREINDATRRTKGGRGCYDAIVPKYKELVNGRDRDYFIRGTYTAMNTDFAADVLSIAEAGFRNISVEPVVLPDGHPLALRREHLQALFEQYEEITRQLEKSDFCSFFHFALDLEQGPCVYKRLRGCGAGFEYAAVSPEGDVYPCHQFVGRTEYRLGNVYDDTFDQAVSKSFARRNIYTIGECRSCWARYYCSGGCAASNLTVNGDMDTPDYIGCALQKKRLECAIYLKTVKLGEKNA